jgi:hypothetical protein
MFHRSRALVASRLRHGRSVVTRESIPQGGDVVRRVRYPHNLFYRRRGTVQRGEEEYLTGCSLRCSDELMGS